MIIKITLNLLQFCCIALSKSALLCFVIYCNFYFPLCSGALVPPRLAAALFAGQATYI